MKRAFLAIVLIPKLAFADPPAVEAVPPGDDQIVVVHAGDKAPFTGQLFDQPTALRWANWMQQYRTLLKVTVDHDTQVCDAKLLYDSTVMTAEKVKTDGVEKDLRDRLTKTDAARAQAQYDADHPTWYKSVWFGVGVGVVGTLAVTYAASRVLSSH
jgi:hypothetical protein